MVPDPDVTETTLAAVMFTVFGEQTAGGLVTEICGVGLTVTVVVTVELHPATFVIVHWYVDVPVTVGVNVYGLDVDNTVAGAAVFTQE